MNYSDTYMGSAMSKRILNLIPLAFIFVGLYSCAPVKFSKSDAIVVDNGIVPISCVPKINNTLISFTYSNTANPDITSQCNPSTDVTYTWTVKNASGTVITTPVAGLSGANPTGVDFTPLGTGSYYVFLQATDNNGHLPAFNSSTPLEFIVPGGGLGTLVCDPKLNSTLTSVVVGNADANPTVAANCNPAANTHVWTVYKGSSLVVVPGLGGASSSNPDFKSLGAGDYRVYLYATAMNTTSYTSTALNVKIINDTDPGPGGNILCNPRINGNLTSLTITPSSPNPLISSSCTPTSVQYNWTVTKNGQTINVSGLAGSNSNPNFLAQGEGTYLIYLTATKPGVNPWNANQPLVLTVDSGGGNPNLTLNCLPRLNGTQVAVTIPTSGTNPTVTSGCNPSTVTHTWTVTKAGATITLPGLAGSSSVPNFIGTGLGTYFLTLTASAPGYNTYVSPYQLEVTVSNGNPAIRHVTFTKNVNVTDNKVDILLVVDDSNSMLPENQRLAQKLQGFVNDLTASGLDWQMCGTVTRAQTINGTAYWGASKNWVGYIGSPAWILKLGAANPYAIFTDTINAIGAGWAGTDDERAIKAAYTSVDYAAYNNCYRADASLAVIVLSDEDERSIGGNMALQYYYQEWKALEAEDYPQAFVNKVKQKFGANKPFSVNSIIVKPGDTACMAAQDAGGAKSHYGYKYAELSQLTQGYVGSICDADYSQSLYYFKDKIKQSLSSIALECAPVGAVNVVITPAMGGVTSQVVNNTLVFTPAIPAGRTVTIGYDCPMH
jgi:hypothetical protein